MFQSTQDSIAQAAPIQDRLQYIHSIVYLAQYELKRDLASKYLKSQVFMSALALFKVIK